MHVSQVGDKEGNTFLGNPCGLVSFFTVMDLSLQLKFDQIFVDIICMNESV